MKTGLNVIIYSFLLCVVATLFISINFIYKDLFKVKYEELPEINNVDVFDSELDNNGINEIIKVSKYKSHLGFQMNYEVDKFKISLQSDSSVFFYLKDNEDIYLRVEKLTNKDYYDSYNKKRIDEIVNGYKYQYQYLRKNKSYFKITIKNLNSEEYSYLDSRFNYMTNSFDILN